MTNIVDQVVKHFKSQNKLAKVLGVKRQNIQQYRAKGCFPKKRAFSIEKLTDGKFSAGDLVLGRMRK